MTDQDEKRRSLSFKEQILRDLSQSKKRRQEDGVQTHSVPVKSEIDRHQPAEPNKVSPLQLSKAQSATEAPFSTISKTSEKSVSKSGAFPNLPKKKEQPKQLSSAVSLASNTRNVKERHKNRSEGKSVQIPLSIGKKDVQTAETEALRKQRRTPAAKEKAHAQAVKKQQPGSQIRLKSAPGNSLSFTQEEKKHLSRPIKETKLARVEAVDWEGEEMEKRQEKRDRQNQTAKKIVRIVTLVVVVCLIATGIFGYSYIRSALGPIDKDSTEYVQVEVPIGSSNREIGRILEESGLIRSGQVFNFYTQFKNQADFQSGYYNFQKNMSVEEIIAQLKEGGTESPSAPSLGKITIPEGYTIEQIADTVTKNAASKNGKDKSIFSRDDFLDKVQDDTFIEAEVAKYPTLLASLPSKESGVRYRLEGYLFPATYDYNEGDTVETLIDQMLAAMDQNLSPYYEAIAGQQKTVNDILTLASLVEKEGATDEDRKNIASAFNNRLSQQMPLQSNIAILYATGKLGQKTTLAEDAAIDTNIDSPYNIYKRQGLMPGPVDNPGMAAIRATIDPNKTDYLYFVADVTTGTVYYANNIEEHNRNVEEHVNSKLAN